MGILDGLGNAASQAGGFFKGAGEVLWETGGGVATLGGNALMRWAAEMGESASQQVRAVASICSPLDLAAGGHAIGVELLGVDAGSYGSQIRSSVGMEDVQQSFIKAVVFGATISWIAVYQGYHAAPTSEGVSRATTSTVVVSSLSILALDFVLTAFMFR